MADEPNRDNSEPFEVAEDAQYEPFPKMNPFVKWFAISMGIQFVAWLLMFVVYPFRPIYYLVYFPFFFVFPGPHYPRYGLAFFIFYLPIAGSVTYSILAGLVATRIRNKRLNKTEFRIDAE